MWHITYRNLIGQSSLGIHCHLIVTGLDPPLAVHLSVGLLPYI